MKYKQGINENRRDHMRVDAQLHFCVSVVSAFDEETGRYIYNDCFCGKTTNISLGGAAMPLGRQLAMGSIVQLSAPETMKRPECLACDSAYLYKNKLDLTPILGTVVWVSGLYCGIRFKPLSTRNEAVLSKYIWDEHLSDIRDEKKKNIIHKKF